MVIANQDITGSISVFTRVLEVSKIYSVKEGMRRNVRLALAGGTHICRGGG